MKNCVVGWVCSNHCRMALVIALCTIAFLLLLSEDSYLYLIGPRVDSAWFFMCGKAWMNGMTPYVDFADSKGALLWLIYGIGYLLSPRDYHGVFWLGCLFYSFTFYFIYRTLFIFIRHSWQALVGTFLIGIILFNPATHNEIRAEDFSMPFIMLSIWFTCRFAFEKEWNPKNMFTIFILYGISLGCTFFIKYNGTMYVVMCAAVSVYYVWKRNRLILKPFVGMACGALLIVTPFLIYFLIDGNFNAFIREYFINTLTTIDNLKESPSWVATFVYRLKIYISFRPLSVLIICLGVGSVAMSKILRHPLPTLHFAVFFIFTAGLSPYQYYLELMTTSGIWLVLLLYRCPWVKRNPLRISSALLATGIVALFAYYHIFSPQSIFNRHTKEELYKIEHIYQAYHRPKVTCVMMENGFGVTAEALPASKYWSRQNGFTAEMHRINLEGIAHSDVVAVEDKYLGDAQIRKMLSDHGFCHQTKVKPYLHTFYIFTKTDPSAKEQR